MRRFLRAVMAAAHVAAGAGQAASALTLYPVLDCGGWVHARRAGESRTLEIYVVGLLNGLSLSSGREFWLAGAPVRTEEIFRWVDARCRTHPLLNLDLAIADMFEDRASGG